MKLKEKNIRYEHDRGFYRVDITRKGRRITRTAPSLEEAKVIRDEILYKLSNNLPIESKATKGNKANQGSPLSLKAAADAVWESKWKHAKAYKFYKVNTGLLLDYFGPQTDLSKVTKQDIQAFVEYCLKAGNAKSTVNRKLSLLRTIIREAAKAYPDVSFPTVPDSFKEKEGRIRVLKAEEEEQLLSILKAADERAYCGVIILLDTGLRESELVKLQPRDIDLDQGCITVIDSKNGTNRTIPLSKRAKACFEVALNADWKFHKSFLQWHWTKAREQMGLTDDPEFIPYCLRHTCATRLITGWEDRPPMPQSLVQYWMGHKRGETTERYVHVSPLHLWKYMQV